MYARLILLTCLAIGIVPNVAFELPGFYEFAHFQALEHDDVVVVKFSSTTDVDFDKKLTNAEIDLALKERTWTLTKKVIVNELVGMIKNNTGFIVKSSGISHWYNAVMTGRGFDGDTVENTNLSEKIMWFLKELSVAKPDPEVVALYSDLHPDVNKQYYLSYVFRITIPTSILACDISSIFDSAATTELYIRTVKDGVIASKISSEEFDRFCEKYIPPVIRYVVSQISNKPKDKADAIISVFSEIPFPVLGKNKSPISHGPFQKDNPAFIVFGKNTNDEDSSLPPTGPASPDDSNISLPDQEEYSVAHLKAVGLGSSILIKLIPKLQLIIPALKTDHPVPAKERTWMLMKKMIINELFGMMINNTGFLIKPSGISKLYNMVMASRGVGDDTIQDASMSDKIKWFLKELSFAKPDPLMISVYSSFFPDTNKQYFVSHMLRIIAPSVIMVHDKSTLFNTEAGIKSFTNKVVRRISDKRSKEFEEFCDEYVPILIRFVVDEINGTTKDSGEPDIFSVRLDITFPYVRNENETELSSTGNPLDIAFGKL